MSDETPAATPKKRAGWPKGKPRPRKPAAPTPEVVKAIADRAEMKTVRPAASMMSKMKARPNWDDDTFDFVGDEGSDRLHIPQDVVQRLARDGVALQWVSRSIRGQEAKQEVSKFTKGGWTPVHDDDFDGIFDGMFMPKGSGDVVGVEDCMLVARPMAIHEKAKAREYAKAREPISIKEAELGAGLNVSGGNHPSAVRQNHITRSLERINIPKE